MIIPAPLVLVVVVDVVTVVVLGIAIIVVADGGTKVGGAKTLRSNVSEPDGCDRYTS